MRAARRWWLTGAAAALGALVVGAPGGTAPLSAAAPGSTFVGTEHVYKGGANPKAGEAERLTALPGTIDDVDAVGQALHQDRQAKALPTVLANKHWVSRGPFGIDEPPGYSQSGQRFRRVTGMAGAVASPAGHPDTVYIGNMGGLWRSTDAGKTWTNLSDGKLPRVAVGAIAIDPTDSKTLYVGTGISFNSLSGDAVGTGIYVSRDGGRTFTRSKQNTTGYAVRQIAVAGGVVMAATNDGLFRSTDKGRSFTRIPLPTAGNGKEATGPFARYISSVVIKPSNPKEVTAAVGFFYGAGKLPDGRVASPGNGLYRSTNGGKTFTRLAGTDDLSNPGSSADPIGTVVLTYGKAQGEQNVLWAALSDAGLARGAAPGGLDVLQDASGAGLNPTGTVFNGLYRSDDDGATFTVKATPQTLNTSPNSVLTALGPLGYGIGVQGDYNLWVQADPNVPGQVYLGLEEVFQGVPSVPGTPQSPYLFSTVQRYADICGFLSYTQNVTEGASCPDQVPVVGGESTHPDQHVALTVDTANGTRIYTGNDGGFFRQDAHAVTPADTGNQATTGFDNDHWQAMNTLSTTEPWNVSRLPSGEIIAGLQDNGAIIVPKGSKNGIEVCGGDGINVLPTPDSDVFYCSYTGAQMYVTTDHGHTIKEIQPGLTAAQFLSPAEIDPTDPKHLVAAANDVKETVKGADTQVLFDPVLGTIVQSDWQESKALGNSPVTDPSSGSKYLWQTTALAVRGANIYAAICGPCRGAFTDAKILKPAIATNVKPGCTPKKAASDCWHIVASKGLPKGYPTAVVMDPRDRRTIYVAFGELNPYGYPVGKTGTARVAMSTDGGAHFRDITGDLPTGSVYGLVWRAGHLIAATETGVYQDPAGDGKWARLGSSLPYGVPVRDMYLDPTGRYVVVSLYGRGAWELDLGARAASSNGPGKNGSPSAGGAGGGAGGSGGNGGTLSDTGGSRLVPIAALVLLALAGVTARRSRTSRTRP